MCLAIVKPKGKTIPEEYLRNGFENNSDGSGLCYAHQGRLYVIKSFNINRFLEEYAVVEHLDLLIHFRFATHGDTDEANCHPWLLLNDRLAVIHNGIINIQCADEKMSDTGHFVREVLEPVAKRIPLTHPAVKYLIEQAIGDGNKLAVMDTAGDCTIFNEGSGEWNDGVWYSNSGYKTQRSIYNFTPYWRQREDFIMLEEERRELIDHYIDQGFDKDTAISVADADIEMNGAPNQ